MKKMLTDNLGLKLLSVLFAIMLWLIVVNIDDPVITQDFSPIRVTMLNEDAVTGKDKVYKIEDNSDIISVRVKAKRSVINKLSVEDFTATADMEKNIKFDNLVGIEVSCSNKNVKSSDITKSRENVVISIEDASTEQFNVGVDTVGTQASGYVIGTAVPEQGLIQISGPSSVIAKIKRVAVEISITGVNSDRTLTGTVYLYDSDGSKLDTSYLDYYGKTEGMDVNVTVLKTKTVPLRVGCSGVPAEGYSFLRLSYKPEMIEIAGASADIGSVSAVVIPDEVVDITGISEDTQFSVDISEYLPSGIRLANDTDTTVAISVELEKKQGKTIRIPVSQISFRNMPKGLDVDFEDLEEIEIMVMGTSAELAELQTDEIAVTLNLSGCKAGTCKKTAEITLPGDCTLMNEVEIEFSLVKGKASSSENSGEEKKDPENSGGMTEGGSSSNNGSGSGSSSSGNGNSGSGSGNGGSGSSSSGGSTSGKGDEGSTGGSSTGESNKNNTEAE